MTTVDGKEHLCAVIGTATFKRNYIADKVEEWVDEITTLSEIAKFAQQEAYTCFTSGYKHKLSYFMRTMPDLKENRTGKTEDLLSTRTSKKKSNPV